MRTILHAVLSFVTVASVSAVAWAPILPVAQAQETKNAAAQAAGVVRGVDRPGARLKIDHGPIPSIGMPAMVMTFKVKDPALLGALKEGDRIDFTIERSGLGWVVVSLSKK